MCNTDPLDLDPEHCSPPVILVFYTLGSRKQCCGTGIAGTVIFVLAEPGPECITFPVPELNVDPDPI